MVNYEYIDKNRINELGKICVWGTGIDAEELIREVVCPDDIKIFIDSNRDGQLFWGKRVISIYDFLKEKNVEPIVIATYRFANEILKQIEESNINNTIYVWDNQHIFSYNEDITNFIKFNNNTWNKEIRNKETENIILMPFDNRHSIRPIIHGAYCANYFAEMYDAKIMGYFRFGAKKENVTDVVYSVYESINMREVIDYKLTTEQLEEVESITDKIWQEIKTWKDWNLICINNIHIGTTIIRHIMRHYIPSLDPKEERMKKILEECIEYFVFWYDYFNNHDVKVVLLADGVCWDGYIRDIAIENSINAYVIDEYFQKTFKDFYRNIHIGYLHRFWEELSLDEKQRGMEWAKAELDDRISGKNEFLQRANDINPFALVSGKRVLKESNKIKILICPHIFEEDSYQCGEHIFDNNYIEWLVHIGELSKELEKYEWYLKNHPSASKRDEMIIDRLISKYPRITKIDKSVNPIQLKKEGISWALTVYGTIAQEYPLIGIQVINAGHNPGETFDYAWNPKSKEEYDYLIRNIEKLVPKENFDDIYNFYAVNYLYYDRRDYFLSNIFFKNEKLELTRKTLLRLGLDYGTWQYKEYMNEWTEERHELIKKAIPEIFKTLDNWKPNVFYKKENYD